MQSQCPEDIRTLFHGDTFNAHTIAARAFAATQAEQKRPGYCYFSNHDIPGNDGAGAYHGSDLWFTFNTLDKCWRPFSGKHYDLARMTLRYRTNFIKNGDPNGQDQDGAPLPELKSVSEDPQFVQKFTDVPARETCVLDSGVYYRIRYKLGRQV